MALSISLKSSIFVSGLFKWPTRTSFILQPKPSIRLCAPKALRNAFWINIKPLRGSRVSHQQAGWELLRARYQRQPFFPQASPGCHSCSSHHRDQQEVGSDGPKGNSDSKDVPRVLHGGEGPGDREPFICRVGGDLVGALVTHWPETGSLLCPHRLRHLKEGP